MFSQMSSSAETGNALIKPMLTATEARRIFLHTAILESLFGGLIAGKIHEDSFASGLKHVMVLALVSGVAFYLLLH